MGGYSYADDLLGGAGEAKVIQVRGGNQVFKHSYADDLLGETSSVPAGPAQDKVPKRDFGLDFSAAPKDIRSAIAKLSAADQTLARKQWAEHYVAAERKGNSSAAQSFMDRTRQFTAAPIRPWLDELSGGLGQALHSLSGGTIGAPYDEAKALSQARKDAEDQNVTTVASLPLLGDITTGTLAQIGGGILAAPAMPAITAIRGATMLPRIVNSAVTGAAYGGLLGAGEGDGLGDRALHGAGGAALGGLLGAATPPVASGVANSIGYVADKFRSVPDILKQYGRPAVERVARAAEDDGLIPSGGPVMPVGTPGASRIQQRSAMWQRNSPTPGVPMGNTTGSRLSSRLPMMQDPEAMVMDIGPNLTGQASAIHNMPGAGRTQIGQSLTERRAAAPERISANLDSALGATVADKTFERRVVKDASAKAKPFYDEFYATPVKPSEDLAKLMDRAQAVGAFDKARKIMQIDGIDPNSPANTGRFLDLIKRGIDDVARDAPRGSNMERLTGNLAREFRNEVDRILSPHDPSQSIWARARSTAGEGLSVREAIQEGKTAFGKGATASELGAELGALAPPAQEGFKQGARQQVRQAMTQSSTQWGDNGDTAVRRMLGSLDARDKLRLIVDDARNADRLAGRLDAETAYARTDQAVMGNSVTAGRLQAQKEFPSAADSSEAASRLGNKSVAGIAMEAGYRLANALTGGAISERRMMVAEQAAKMLTAKGVQAQQIIDGLLKYKRTTALSRMRRDQIDGLIVRLIEGSRQPAVSGAVGG